MRLDSQAGYTTDDGTGSRAVGGDQDAVAVQRLRDAGALIIGKARMQEFNFGLTGANNVFGPTRNPFAPDRCAGNGCAAAVAMGLCESFVSVSPFPSLFVQHCM
jgi:Asp-tRNA(Asn)/Glu-tRNA(Gln) amidotransferase A subunit family amidase